MNISMQKFLQHLEKYSQTHSGIYSVPYNEGQFLHFLVTLLAPKRILELGTSVGFSTIWMALAAKQYGGKIVTIEVDPEKVKKARENFKKAKVDKTITLIHGNAHTAIKKLKGKFDFVFLDARKKDYLKLFKLFYPKLEKDSFVAANNAINFARELKSYLNYVRKNKNLKSMLIPVGNGIELTCKLK